MKVLLSLLLAISVFSSSAHADTKKENEELISDRLWHLAGLPVWYLAWVNVHEGSHALTAMAYEYEIISYKPYPHFEDGRFMFGSFKARCPQAVRRDGQPDPEEWSLRCRDGDGMALIMVMPSIVDASVFAASDTLLSTGAVDSDSLGGRLLFVGGMVAPWIDLTLATSAVWRKGGDHAQFTRLIGIERWQVAVVGNAIAVIGLWRLYVQGKAVFYDQKSESEEGGVVPVPFSTSDSVGLSLGTRW